MREGGRGRKLIEHLSITSGDSAWRLSALCAQHPEVEFFPDERGPGDPYAEAREICDRCPVTAECLEYGLLNNEPVGLYGGFTPKERKAMRRHKRSPIDTRR